MAEVKKDSGFFRRGLERVGLMKVRVDLTTLLANPDGYLNRSLETEGNVRYSDSFHPKDDWGETEKWSLVSRFRFTEGELPNGDPLFLAVIRDTPEKDRDDLMKAQRLWVQGRLAKVTSESGRLEGYMIGSGKYRIVN